LRVTASGEEHGVPIRSMTIKIKKANKGKLHRALGVPSGKKIPASKLSKAKNSKSAAVRKEANFAANAKKWNKK
jgi:hypothetical protein